MFLSVRIEIVKKLRYNIIMQKFFFNLSEFITTFVEPKKDHIGQWLAFWLSSVVGLSIMIQLWNVLPYPELLKNSLQLVGIFLPFLVPLACIRVLYMRYIQADFIKKSGAVLLEIKVPKETNRSPLAMEIFFTALYQTGSATILEAFWMGKIRPWFSMELVSIDGEIHFFIWSFKKWKNLIEAQLYAQYPTVEIHEVPDYTESMIHDPDNMPFWATYFKLEKDDVYPIKTYVDYGLDKLDLKEEFKIDPMTSVIEYLGSLKKGEQAWIQILIQAHRKEKLVDAKFWGFKDDWKKEIDEEVEKIREKATPEPHKSGHGEDAKTFPSFPNPTPGQIETIKALERSKGKFPFETAIRGFYIAKKEAFNPISLTGLIGSFRQYNSNNLNGFKLGWYTDPDLPWRDFGRRRRNMWEKEMLEAYKLRSFFRYPFKFFEASPIILMTEELATIFHFPGGVSQTPTLERIMSKKAEPPANLPR